MINKVTLSTFESAEQGKTAKLLSLLNYLLNKRELTSIEGKKHCAIS